MPSWNCYWWQNLLRADAETRAGAGALLMFEGQPQRAQKAGRPYERPQAQPTCRTNANCQPMAASQDAIQLMFTALAKRACSARRGGGGRCVWVGGGGWGGDQEGGVQRTQQMSLPMATKLGGCPRKRRREGM